MDSPLNFINNNFRVGVLMGEREIEVESGSDKRGERAEKA